MLDNLVSFEFKHFIFSLPVHEVQGELVWSYFFRRLSVVGRQQLPLLTLSRLHFASELHEILSGCVSELYLGQVQIWVILENISQSPEAAFLQWASWNFVRMFVLMISSQCRKMGHIR